MNVHLMNVVNVINVISFKKKCPMCQLIHFSKNRALSELAPPFEHIFFEILKVQFFS